jgi:hypothetical protein
MLKKTIIIAFTFSRPYMNRLCHSRTRVRDVTLSPYTSFNSWNHSVGVFSVSQEISVRLRWSIFILSRNRQSNTTWSHSDKAERQTNWHRESSPVLFDRETSRSITYHSLSTHTSFHGTVRAIPLFYSRTSYFNQTFISCEYTMKGNVR